MPLPTTKNQLKGNVPRRDRRGKRKAKDTQHIPPPNGEDYSDIEVDEDGETWISLIDTVNENGIPADVKRKCHWAYYYSTFVLPKINIDDKPMGIWYQSEKEFDRQEYGKSRTKVYFPSDQMTTEVILYPHEGSQKEFVEYFRRNSNVDVKVKKKRKVEKPTPEKTNGASEETQGEAQDAQEDSSSEGEENDEAQDMGEDSQGASEKEGQDKGEAPTDEEETDEGEAPTAGDSSNKPAQQEPPKAAHRDISGSSSSSGISLPLYHIFFELGGAWEKLKTEELSLVDYIVNSFDESRHEDYLKYAFEMWSAVKGREFSEDHFLAFADEIHAKSPPERLGHHITKEKLIYRMCMIIGIASKTPTANFLDAFSQTFERNASDGDDWKKKYLEHMLRGWAMKHEGDVNMKGMEFFNFVKNISETINGVECMPPSA